MAQTAADILVETLMDWGIDTVFGIPGDGINGIMEALRQRQDAIRFIQVRHEEAAAFAACGYAKFTGRIGCCLATSGPGGIHLLNGLYDAKLDGAPVLAITGLQFHDLIGTHTQQDVALDKLFMDVAQYNERIMGAAHVENVVSQACRTALAYRTVSHVTVPVDIQDQPVTKDMRSKRNPPHHVSAFMAYGGHMPDSVELQMAANVLNEGSKVAILAGRGALGTGDRLAALADTLAAPVATALLGKGALPDDSPFATGGVGLLGTRPSQEALRDCDTLLIVGSSFPYIEFYPKPGKAKGVQIDIDPARIGLRYPVELGLVGDVGRVIDALLPLLHRKTDRGFLEQAQNGMRAWAELEHKRATRMDKPMKPQVVARAVAAHLGDEAIVTTDSGTITSWFARGIPMRGPRRCAVSGNLATMGCALPYAIGAAAAYPNREIVAFVGDGGLSMVLAELATCVKYRMPIKIVVIKNNTLGQIKWEQMVFLGNPEYGCDLQPIDFATVARGFGLTAFSVDDPTQCDAVIQQALRTPGPVLVEAVVDENEPPMPPSVKFEQAEHLAEALVRGTKDAGTIVKTIAKDRVREIV